MIHIDCSVCVGINLLADHFVHSFVSLFFSQRSVPSKKGLRKHKSDYMCRNSDFEERVFLSSLKLSNVMFRTKTSKCHVLMEDSTCKEKTHRNSRSQITLT